MIASLTEQPVSAPPRAEGTIWGLDPVSLHDRYWASRGVQVVRVGEVTPIDRKAELFLLIDPARLVLFDLLNWIDVLNWTKPDLLFLKLHYKTNLGYREVLTANERGDFLRFERRYKAAEVLTTRVALTCVPELAEAWELAPGVFEGWRQLRVGVPSSYREIRSSPARIYHRNVEKEKGQFVEDLVGIWNHPGATVSRATRLLSNAWVDEIAQVDRNARIVGPVWVGAGRQLTETDVVVGPAILWDDPSKRPVPDELRWADIEPTNEADRLQFHRPRSSAYRIYKRVFDLFFSFVGLVLTLPLYPFIMLAIYLEDGRPFFFLQERETIGGRAFRCLKFRSMRRNADQLIMGLRERNQADGPQFFIDDDPRITRIGAVMRKTHLDELPQFFNVLLGHMSLVGPRPSPYKENQWCPEWRETRLSVRPGITGLWQLQRTRLPGFDFQEWIKYDIQYVEKMSWALDLKLMSQTVAVILRRMVRS